MHGIDINFVKKVEKSELIFLKKESVLHKSKRVGGGSNFIYLRKPIQFSLFKNLVRIITLLLMV